MSCTHVRTQILMTVVLLLLGGCASPPGFTPPGRERIIGYGTPTDTLRCQSPRLEANADTQVVDTNGDTLSTGNVQLIIPRGALAGPHRLILRQDSGQFMRAQIEVSEPEPVRQQTGRGVPFQNNRSARLIFDISGCNQRNVDWSVWRLNPDSSQELETRSNPSRAITAIDSTSWFIIAN